MGTNPAKPYKIQDWGGSRKFGVTAGSLEELKNKAEKRLNISGDFSVFQADGTEVTSNDYFATLPPQTCFTFINAEEEDLNADLLQVERLTQRIFKRLSEGQTLAREVQAFLTGPHSEIVNRVLLDYVTALQSNIELESRQDDAAWFVGLSGKHQTKEAAMKASAQSRIRNYYQKMKDYAIEQDSSSETMLLVNCMQQRLRLNEYHGDYFVRSAKEPLRICDDMGWFLCCGAFDEEDCSNRHSINPYGSKEARILFSTWNLDHVIEKSREVIPTFVKVSESCPKNRQVNWQYFYNLLFTRENLKLVHIACHIKTAHSGKVCDKKQFYEPKQMASKAGKIVKTRTTRTTRKRR